MTDLPAFPMPRGCPLDPPEELAARRPIGRVRIWDGSTPWLITRHDDVRAVLADSRFSSDPTKAGFPSQSPVSKYRRENSGGRSFLTMDDPEHARYRRMLVGEFTVRRIEALRPLIVESVSDLLGEMAAGPNPVDFVRAFALPLPSLVICHLLGVPYADHELFQRLSSSMLDATGDPADALSAGKELGLYVHDLVKAKQAEPGDDLLSRLIDARLRTGELTSREVTSMAVLLLIAGHDTTMNQLGLGLAALLRNPDQAKQLRETTDPGVINGAVEELLRLLTITHFGRRRVATEDVEIGGTLIKAGDGVIAAADIANRDPDVFADPDRFDPARKPNRHVAFGFGVHQCLGQPLARLELQLAFPALLRRFPDLRLAVDFDEIEFRAKLPIYGPTALPVTW
ncbi:MAG TPA: cytochrome P450 [Pseudonocardiaceae bacterium]|nr:cytochrome P450 [Pseudonocardiaceae bacterium]